MEEDRLYCRISPDLKKEVFEYAEKNRFTFSDVVRKALSSYIFSKTGFGGVEKYRNLRK